MANDKFEKDPFEKYDYLFDEQEKKYQKQNNSRYKLSKTPKKKIIVEPTKPTQRYSKEKQTAIQWFGLIFVGFIVYYFFMASGFTFRSFIIPVLVAGFWIYSFIKNNK